MRADQHSDAGSTRVYILTGKTIGLKKERTGFNKRQTRKKKNREGKQASKADKLLAISVLRTNPLQITKRNLKSVVHIAHS